MIKTLRSFWCHADKVLWKLSEFSIRFDHSLTWVRNGLENWIKQTSKQIFHLPLNDATWVWSGKRLLNALFSWETSLSWSLILLLMGLSHRPGLTHAGLLNGLHLTLIMATITKPQDVRKIKHGELAHGTADTL